MKVLKIDIISDIVCPWCEIGHVRLLKAMATNPQYDYSVHFRPFQLHPFVPEGGMDKEAVYLKKFGVPSLSDDMTKPLRDAASDLGLVMNFNKLKNMPNTVKAHRLIAFAARKKLNREMTMALFQMYFEEGLDLEEDLLLADRAVKVGLDRKETLAFLRTQEGKAEILEEAEKWRGKGIQGVPTFIINDKFIIQGAQPPEVWPQVFEKIEKMMAKERSDARTGEFCEGDECAL